MFAKIPEERLSDQDLHAFVDGELDGRRYRRVVQQLATDPGATERLNGFLRQHGDLAFLRERLCDAEIEEDSRTAELARELSRTVRHHRRVRLSSVASSLLLAGIVGGWTVWGPDTSTVAQRFASLNNGPQVLFGRDPFGSSSQLVTTETGGMVVDEQLAAYSVRRPDFAAHGLTFVGGNPLQSGESPAIRLVYEDVEHRKVYLFVGTVGTEADVALTLVPEGHVSLNWRRGPLVFALIGPKESEQLLELMESTSEFLAPVPSQRPDATSGAVDTTPVVAPPAEVGQPVTMPQTSAGVAPVPVPPAEPGGLDTVEPTTPVVAPITGADNRPKAL